MVSKPGLGDLATAEPANAGIGALNIGNALDTVDFVRKAWSSFGVPSALAPTTDLDEIDRRIDDLKAVEQWLAVNLNMLQGTIQAIELQRCALATLKAYGGAIGESAAALPGAQAIADAFAAGMQAIQAAGTPSSADDAHAGAAASQATPEAGHEERAAVHTGLDPASWWEMLQQQFTQIASAAMSGVGLASPASSDADAAPAPRRARRTSAARHAAANEGAPVARRSSKGSAARTLSASTAASVDAGSRASAGASKSARRGRAKG